MTDLSRMLHEERATLTKRLAGIDAAISALNSSGAPVKKKRAWKMSAEARAKISAAAKRRWAKVKGAPKKRVLTAKARAKMSAAAKKRWAKTRG